MMSSSKASQSASSLFMSSFDCIKSILLRLSRIPSFFEPLSRPVKKWTYKFDTQNVIPFHEVSQTAPSVQTVHQSLCPLHINRNEEGFPTIKLWTLYYSHIPPPTRLPGGTLTLFAFINCGENRVQSTVNCIKQGPKTRHRIRRLPL